MKKPDEKISGSKNNFKMWLKDTATSVNWIERELKEAREILKQYDFKKGGRIKNN